MKFIKLLFIFVFAAFLQWMFDTRLTVFGFTPAFMYLAALGVAVSFRAPAAIAFAFCCGFYVDFLGGSLFGAHALTYTCAAFITGLLHKRMDLGSITTQMLYCVVLASAEIVFMGLLALVFSGTFLWPGPKGFVLMPLFSGVISPLLFLLVAVLHTEEK